MKKQNGNNRTFFCECFFEKCMEWIDFLRYGVIKRDEWISNLSEHYCIYKEYMEKDFVKDFLNERKRILTNNRYRMYIKAIDEKGDKNIIGKVMLYSKDKFIHQATLKIKDNEDSTPGNLIFWSFEKE